MAWDVIKVLVSERSTHCQISHQKALGWCRLHICGQILFCRSLSEELALVRREVESLRGICQGAGDRWDLREKSTKYPRLQSTPFWKFNMFTFSLLICAPNISLFGKFGKFIYLKIFFTKYCSRSEQGISSLAQLTRNMQSRQVFHYKSLKCICGLFEIILTE